MNPDEVKKPFKRKKPLPKNGSHQPMQPELRSRISHPQPLLTTKRANTNSDITRPPPELHKQQSNTNTPSLEVILKGKVIKEFVPMAQKQQDSLTSRKLVNEPAKNSPSVSQPTPRFVPLIRTSRPQMFRMQQPGPFRQPFRPPYRPLQPLRPQLQPQRLQHQPPRFQQNPQGCPPQRMPPGAFYVPRLTPKPKITKPIWAVNNKTTHFRYDASFVAFAQTFKVEDFDKLAINALSAITPDIESDHKRTCYDFVSTIRLWYKTVDYLRRITPKTPQQQIQLGYLTHTDRQIFWHSSC